ncbi:hypothetical protein AAW12_05035 [Sphingobacterium sp. Ag1]|uniref:hypothetical protein n=1 Tax=Sphingobacterium sp. Ag1 TaxID=1643451 RepID=UPI000627C319|nr:hypothetical protein [Sphingobacterium sp. Ag1]KKO92466.1 hypothetical protein AAW12_05035 [Sphingobacterium sp. Ag1]
MFKKLKFTELIVFLLLVMITSVWLFKLSHFPGLHGDEAWFGIRANQLDNGGAFSWHGMNYYSGSLQEILSAVSFKLLGKGIFQLRIVGLISNVIALLLFVRSLSLIFSNRTVAIFFLLLFAQCTSWLVYPRIAWEVTSLTLLFLSVSLWFSRKIINGNYHFYYSFAFLGVHLLGSYNHIIFASVPLSMFVAAITFSLIKHTFDIKIFVITLFNILNVVWLFLLMNYQKGYLLDVYIIPSAIGVLFILLSESFIIGRIKNRHVDLNKLRLNRCSVYIKGFLIVGVCFFVWNHGVAFFGFLCNFKTLEHVYSFESSLVMIGFNCLLVSALLFFFIRGSVFDLMTFSSFPVVFIFSYMGVFSLFTTANSPRYYLCISILIYLYTAYSIYKFPRKALPKLAILFIVAIICQLQLWKIYTDLNYKFTPKYVSFGKNEEPSSHFFPVWPVVEFLRIHKIETVQTISNDYFIKTPIQFMENICPWQKNMGTKVIVDYSETGINGGFIILKKD